MGLYHSEYPSRYAQFGAHRVNAHRWLQTLTVAGAVGEGRAAFGRQAWAEAYELLANAGERELLDPEDLERLAIAAYLVGRGVGWLADTGDAL